MIVKDGADKIERYLTTTWLDNHVLVENNDSFNQRDCVTRFSAPFLVKKTPPGPI